MNMRFMFAWLTCLALAPWALPAFAEAGAAPAAATATAMPAPAQPLARCAQPAAGKLKTAQVATECCKDHKGVCGCRAGKIICCDGSASTQPGCTCHGDNGFVE